MLEKIESSEIENKINEIKSYTKDAEQNLNSINNLIEESVGYNGSAWRGEDAVAFKNDWNTLADKFQSFIDIFQKQTDNLEKLINNNKG